MDGGTKDKVGSSRENGDRLSYQTHSIPSEWRFSGDLSESSFNMVATDPSTPVFKGVPVESSSCPSVSMLDCFASSVWDNHNLALRQIDFDSNQNTNAFAQSGADILSQSFAQFPADSGFIERAARFSCFSGGSFSDMVNPFPISGSPSLHSKGSGGGIAQACPLQQSCSSQNNEMGVSGVSKSGLLLGNQLMDQEDSTKKIEHKLANLLKYSGSGNGEDTKKRIMSSGNGSENQEISGCGGDGTPHLEGLSIEHPVKPHLPKKKRKNTQGAEVNEVHSSSPVATDTANDSAEHKEKIEPNQTTSVVKPYGKQPKDNSGSDAPKEDYIHVRARRGQATNSHSLAERVRREKISERMKFLQDLVPGCNKVTGKAVMLDEIINYVQSLQQQVEFLSMKLATVTPSLDLSIESLLPKDILQSQAGPSAVHSLHDVNMVNPQLHLTHASIPTGATGIVDPSVSLRRAINSHLTCINGYREIPSEIPGAWGDDLHNVVQMSFSANVPFEHHELTGSLPPGSMKTEL